jgi:hypothetical protein
VEAPWPATESRRRRKRTGACGRQHPQRSAIAGTGHSSVATFGQAQVPSRQHAEIRLCPQVSSSGRQP